MPTFSVFFPNITNYLSGISKYLIDWGDNTSIEWLGLYDSGEEIILSHTWAEQGNYIIKAKAKDTNDIESEWSDPLPIKMPKNKVINTPFLRFLENHPHMFPLLRHLLKVQPANLPFFFLLIFLMQ